MIARRVTAPVTLAACLLLPGALPSVAQQDPTRDDLLAIRARRIETVSDAPIENGIVLIRNGKIASVGKTVKIPVGTRVITADTVMPGLVAPYSQIGLSAPGGGAPIQLPPNIPPQIAARFLGGGGGRASANTHFRVLDELYPFEEAYRQLARAGVTTLALVPEGSGFAGQGAVVRPAGPAVGHTTPEKMALAQTSPLAVHFQQDTQTQELIRSTLQGGGGAGSEAGGGTGGGTGGRGPGAAPEDSPGAAEEPAEPDEPFQRRRGGQIPRPGGSVPGAPSALTAAARRLAITRATAGEIPTFIECPDATATVYALALFQAFDKIKPVYVLPSDAYRLAGQLGPKKASVILPADLAFEQNTRNRINPAALLAAAGAKVACRPSADSVNGYEGLLSKVAELVKGGLDRDLALKAITLHPAEMLGVQDRVGSVRFGRDANLILLDGDPLSPVSKITQVLLEGKTVYDGK